MLVPRKDQLNKVEMIFFDAGHTLLRPEPAVERRYVETAARYGVEVDPSEVGRRFSELWRAERAKRSRALFRTDAEGTKRFWHDFVTRVFEPWMHEFATFDGFFKELYEAFARGSAWHLFGDVLPGLERVKSLGYRTAVISNWDHRLRQLLETLEIAKEFETIVISAEEGFEKPAPEIFESALARCGIAPEQALHVGDSLDDDVRGATLAGMLAVHLDRALDRGAPWRWHREGYLVVPSLIAVGEFVEAVGR